MKGTVDPLARFAAPACGGGRRASVDAWRVGVPPQWDSQCGDTPIPALPRKRERERTAFAVRNQTLSHHA